MESRSLIIPPSLNNKSEKAKFRRSATGILRNNFLTVMSSLSKDDSLTKMSAIRLYPRWMSFLSSTWKLPGNDGVQDSLSRRESDLRQLLQSHLGSLDQSGPRIAVGNPRAPWDLQLSENS